MSCTPTTSIGRCSLALEVRVRLECSSHDILEAEPGKLLCLPALVCLDIIIALVTRQLQVCPSAACAENTQRDVLAVRELEASEMPRCDAQRSVILN